MSCQGGAKLYVDTLQVRLRDSDPTLSHCLFVIDQWHWLSSVRIWRLCYSAEHTKH